MPSTQAEKEYAKRYIQSRDNITIRATKEDGAAIRRAAADAGQPVQRYIIQACKERMERDRAAAGRK